MAVQRQYEQPTELEQHEDEQGQIAEQARYREYQEINRNSSKFRELLFFTKIAIFSVFTVLISFILLVLSVRPLLAFPIAMLLSLAFTSTIYYFILSMRR
ncbi:DUF3270 family protein [Streptococcus loxodontisalivarius]|uniref:Uncharacterized membrane protein (DUF485 family) n=1 Tax=Streptococcus loxodontisalivarius TaxID=1349415 RepID=A0ABS2PSJ3_9STRE|nr:DUF3270 family protein [Streptococcus loxodontisalivarius]MBM7643008.1 uncharacterized membrane protein (DUF485 family) [Streptococcus loxodontisalivarius]